MCKPHGQVERPEDLGSTMVFVLSDSPMGDRETIWACLQDCISLNPYYRKFKNEENGEGQGKKVPVTTGQDLTLLNSNFNNYKNHSNNKLVSQNISVLSIKTHEFLTLKA